MADANVNYVIVLMVIIISSTVISESASECYESIISFGDSLADTGNLILLSPKDKPIPAASPPYGETFFHRPTGRYSDGRLIVDFLAESLGLPFVQPYAGGDITEVKGRSYDKGVNFAVAGATALDYEFFAKRGIFNPTNVSLGTQMDWFKQFLAQHPGCLNWLNTHSIYHNKLLQKELSRIRELHPNVTIIYADYYNAMLHFYLSPYEFGFTKEILKACCGAGGSYNYNASTECGILPATSCDNPSSFVSWDGWHFTEATNRLITQGLLEGPYTTPRFKTVCPSMSRQPGIYY